MSELVKKTTIGNFLNYPNTQKFLEDNLREKRGEFVSNLIALVDGDSNLAECDPQRLMMCAMNATALNLPLNKNLGYAYIIPYKGVPSFQIGYKGFIQLAIRSNQYKTINAVEIREGEIERNKITGEIKYLGENPNNGVVGYLAFFELLSGFTASLYMSEAQIEEHALRFSTMYQYDKKNSKRSSKWSDPQFRPKMALKTVLKGLLGTYGVLSTEMQRAFENDSEKEEKTDDSRGFDNAEIVTQNEPTETATPTTVNETEKVTI